MKSKIVNVTLRLIDDMSAKMQKATDSFIEHSKQLQNAGKKISKTGDGISKIGSTMTKNVTAPIIGVGVAAAKTASDFEAQMSRVQAISGANKKELKALTKQAIELGASSVYSAKEAAEGMENMASAGFDTKQIMAAMPGMLNLAASSGEDLATSADIAASAVRGFGLKASETSHVADVLAATAAKTNAAVVDTGEAMKYAAPISNALGISLEETSAAIGIMANAGIKGSQAGTTIRGAFTRIVKPTKQVTDAMDDLGIKFFDSHGKMKSLAKIMEELRNKTKGLTDQEKNEALAKIFGTNALSGMLALVNASPGEFEKLTKSLENSDGAASKMADTMLNNTNGAIEGMKGSLETASIVLGNMLLPYINKGIKYVTELVDKFNTLPEAQQKNIVKWAAMAAAVGPCIFAFGKVVSGLGKVYTTFGKAGKAIKDGAAAFDKIKKVGKIGGMFGKFGKLGKAAFMFITNPAFIAVAAIAAIITITVLLVKNWTKVKKFFVGVGTAIKNTFIKMGNAIKSVLNKMGSVIKKVFKTSGGDATKFSKTFTQVKKTISRIVNGLGKVFRQITKYLSPVVKAVGKHLAKFGNHFMKAAKVAIKWFGKIANFLGKVFTVAFSAGFSAIGGYLSAFANTILDVTSGIMTVLNGIVDFISGIFTGNWEKAWTGVKEIFSGVFESLVGLAKTPINGVIGIINGAVSGINKLGLKIPDWVPGLGGKNFSINIPTIPMLARGTKNWIGGLAITQERGGEIMDLPRGTRVYPHDESIAIARAEGTKKSGNKKINIDKLADTIIIREEADIDKFVTKFVDKIENIINNVGGEPVYE